MNICICACQFCRRIPGEKIAAVRAACRAADVSCEIVPDLCFISAKDRKRRDRLGSFDAVLACQPRAVRFLSGNPENVKFVDLRAEPIDAVLRLLELTPSNPASESELPECERSETDWIPWFPVIDADRCVHCRKCVEFCLFGVYAIETEKVRVIRPDACKTDCPACARICPRNAIMFPKSEEPRLNGSLDAPVAPSASEGLSLQERLKHRKKLRLFKEDEQ